MVMQATPYTRATSFADDERNNTGGRATVRTAQVDAELDALATPLNQTIANLALIQRDDGAVRDGVVTPQSLSADTLKILSGTAGAIRGAWVTGAVYAVKDLATQSSNTYVCAVPHTAGVFATDLAAGRWVLLQLGTAPGAAGVTFTATGNIAATTVQAAVVEVDADLRSLVTATDTALRTDLADTATISKGAGLLGFLPALGYVAGSVGAWLKTLMGAGGSVNIGFQQAGGGAVARTVQAKLRESASAVDFGAVGDGVFDCAGALSLSVYPGGAFSLPAGTYKVGSSITIPSTVTMLPGAKLVPNAGVTITFANGLNAGVYQIFDCSAAASAIVFDQAKQRSGYAEWWGAVSALAPPPSPPLAAVQTQNVAAINAAAIALAKVELMPADYYTNARLLVALQGHAIHGHSNLTYGGGLGHSTRIYCTSTTADIIQLGPDVYPGSINACPQGITLRDVYLSRTVAPDVPSGCAGVRMQYTLRARMDRVKSAESIMGFSYINTVSTQVWFCDSNRSVAGTGGTDYWYGFYGNGYNGTAGWDLPGGNASLYHNYCSAGCNIASLQAGLSSGFYFDQQYTDTFFSWCETGDCNVGFNFQGNSAAGTNLGNCDVHMDHCVVDSFRQFGVFIKNSAQAGTIDINNIYCGPNPAATSAIYVQGSRSVTLTGGQLIMGAAPLALGIVIDGSAGVAVCGTQISECGSTVVRLTNANNCRIVPTIKNASVSGGAAVQLLNNCAANYVAPMVLGKAGGVSLGIQVVGAGDVRNEYNCTGIDSACVAAGATNKLVRNGVSITATGLTGSNLVSGVMT